ncbi:MAG: hypothetical protein HHJ12_00105 [Glaciimonas sp.]|nr:hypothetical protein [Glaciimonas sp.]
MLNITKFGIKLQIQPSIKRARILLPARHTGVVAREICVIFGTFLTVLKWKKPKTV